MHYINNNFRIDSNQEKSLGSIVLHHFINNLKNTKEIKQRWTYHWHAYACKTLLSFELSFSISIYSSLVQAKTKPISDTITNKRILITNSSNPISYQYVLSAQRYRLVPVECCNLGDQVKQNNRIKICRAFHRLGWNGVGVQRAR